MKTEEHERAAELIAMLDARPVGPRLVPPRPAGMCREHGLDDVAAELAGRDGALESLDVRESRSSVAGVLLAAAAEGVAFFAFVDNAHAAGRWRRELLARRGQDRRADAAADACRGAGRERRAGRAWRRRAEPMTLAARRRPRRSPNAR